MLPRRLLSKIRMRLETSKRILVRFLGVRVRLRKYDKRGKFNRTDTLSMGELSSRRTN